MYIKIKTNFEYIPNQKNKTIKKYIIVLHFNKYHMDENIRIERSRIIKSIRHSDTFTHSPPPPLRLDLSCDNGRGLAVGDPCHLILLVNIQYANVTYNIGT